MVRYKQTRRWLWNGVRLAIVLGIFAYLYQTNQLDLSRLDVVLYRPAMVATAVALLVVCFGFTVQRWRLLVQIQNMTIPYGLALQLSSIGFFFNMVLPGTVMGDVIKGYYLVRGRDQKTALASTILIDRLVGLYTMIAMAAFAVGFCFVRDGLSTASGIWVLKPVRVLAGFIAALGLALTVTVGLFLLFGQRAGEWLRQNGVRRRWPNWASTLVDGLAGYARFPMLTLKALLFSVMAQVPGYIGMGILANILGAKGLAVADYLFILPVCVVINAIPLAPGGWGVGEVGFRSVFLLYGSDVGAEVAFLYHIILFLLALGMGAIAYAFYDRAAGKSY